MFNASSNDHGYLNNNHHASLASIILNNINICINQLALSRNYSYLLIRFILVSLIDIEKYTGNTDSLTVAATK